jgi:hypothetical protein
MSSQVDSQKPGIKWLPADTLLTYHFTMSVSAIPVGKLEEFGTYEATCGLPAVCQI